MNFRYTRRNWKRKTTNCVEESRNRYADLYDFAPVGYASFDDKGHIQEINLTAAAMLGLERSQLIGKPFIHCVLKSDIKRFLGHLQQCIQANERSTTELCLAIKGGGSIQVQLLSVAVADSERQATLYRTAITDISERKLVEAALFQEKERAQVTLECIGEAVITTDASSFIAYINPSAETLTGWSNSEAQGLALTQIFNIINGTPHKAAENPVEKCLRQGRTVKHTVNMLARRDGQEFAIEDTAAPILDHDGHLVGAVLVFRDVTSERDMNRRLSHQASHDALTGLINRGEFERRLARVLLGARTHKKQHTLCYLDLDLFKIVNDTSGHAAGDELLRQFTILLNTRVRDRDSLARLGGDEFGMLLENCSLDQGLKIADELRRIVEGHEFVWQERTFGISASIGLVPVTADTCSVADLLSAADAACYAAKGKGRNRVQVYHPDDTNLALRHGEMAWITRITKAIGEDRFCLYYQTIAPVSPHSTEGQHYELLVRMVDEEGGLVAPMEFIPAAERYNLMPSIDRWVISAAFAGLERSHRAKSSRDLETCTINLSGASVNDELFLDFIRDQFAQHAVTPQAICFEITETAAVANFTNAIQFIKELKSLGCRFSLDDFGSGLSSLTYLKKLPVDYLKIDGAFVKDIANDPIDYAMVEAANQIGHVMGIRTIAEWVENELILEKLRALGVDYAQGNWIAKPKSWTTGVLKSGAGR